MIDGISQQGIRLLSIYLTGEARKNPALPPTIQRNLDSFIAAHPGASHTLYNDETLREFIKKNFDAFVLAAYDNLIPLAYKADLGRYCLLFNEGGIYSDLSLFHFSPLLESRTDLAKIIVFRDHLSDAPWITSIGFMYSPSKQRVFESCIEAVCRHVRDNYYGANQLCPTGPNLFGRALASTTPLINVRCGEAMRINRYKKYFNYAYISYTGEFIAVSHKRSAGIKTLGGKGDSDYNVAYAVKRIYANHAPTAPRPFVKPLAELLLTAGRYCGSSLLSGVGERLWRM